MSDATCVRCQRALAPDDTHGWCGACLADSLAGALTCGPGLEGSRGGLGDYELLEEIARGGMGIVYRARQRGLNRLVALKIVHANPGAAGGGVERLRNEAELAATLEHPNIVPVYDVGTGDGRPWFTMKLAEGGSLADRIEQSRLPEGAGDSEARVRLRAIASLCAAIAMGVHHAHQHGVLHRDLKPSNILLGRDGEPMVADFGIAVRSDVDATLTQTGAALGTPAYLAPEVARGGAREASVAADIYGLGAILFHLLTGRPPYVGSSAFEVLTQISTREIPSPRSVNGVVPADWATVCLKCLERDPERRYASALELAGECGRLQRGEPILARRVSGSERLWYWTRRRPLVAALTLIALGAAGLGLGGVFWQWRLAEDARHLAESRAVEARRAEERARSGGYFATVAQALALRHQGDLGNARRLLEGLDPRRRGFEWRLLDWFCRGDEVRRVDLGDSEPRCMAWDPGRGRVAVLGVDRVIRWVDAASGAGEVGPTVPVIPEHEGVEVLDRGFHELTFAPDGRHFACSDGDVLLVVETVSGRLLFTAVRRRVGAIWLDDGRVLYSGNTVWAAANGGPGGIFHLDTRREVPLPEGVFAPLAMSADRRTIAWTRDLGEGVRVEVFPASVLEQWVGGRGSSEQGPIEVEHAPALLALSPDGHHLAMAVAAELGSPRVLTVVDLRDRRVVFQHDLQALIHGLTFSPDGGMLSVGTGDTALRQFRFLKPAPRERVYDDDTLPGRAQTVPAGGPRFPPDNLLSRSALGGQVHFRLGHGERIRGLLQTPGAGGLVSISDDRTVRVWAAPEERSRHRVGGVQTWNRWEHPAVSADGRFAVYRAEPDTTWLWDRLRQRHHVIADGHYPLAVRRDGGAVTRNGETGELVLWSPPGASGEPPVVRWKVDGIPSHPGFPYTVRGVLSGDERTVVGLIPGKLLTLDLDTRVAAGTRISGCCTAPAPSMASTFSPTAGCSPSPVSSGGGCGCTRSGIWWGISCRWGTRRTTTPPSPSIRMGAVCSWGTRMAGSGSLTSAPTRNMSPRDGGRRPGRSRPWRCPRMDSWWFRPGIGPWCFGMRLVCRGKLVGSACASV
jgi:WD40 repeat protein